MIKSFRKKKLLNQFQNYGAWQREIVIDGITAKIQRFESILKGSIIMFVFHFFDTQYHLVLATKVDNFNNKETFELRCLYMIGELKGNEFQEKIIGEGKLYADKINRKQHFKISGSIKSKFNLLCNIAFDLVLKEEVL